MKLSDVNIWRLNHILQAIADVEMCVSKKDLNDKILHAALQKFIQNIGEMCRGASKTLQDTYPDIPWRDIIAMRNILVHEYYKIEKETLWDVAEHKIPVLKNWIMGILEKHNGAEAV